MKRRRQQIASVLLLCHVLRENVDILLRIEKQGRHRSVCGYSVVT